MSKKKTFYGPAERPPVMLTVFSSIQHMLLVLSLGLALPVTVARAAGLNPQEAGVLLSISLLSIGITGILQTLPSRFFGNGRMDLSGSDSAALSACAFAAQLGGDASGFRNDSSFRDLQGYHRLIHLPFPQTFPAGSHGNDDFYSGCQHYPHCHQILPGAASF